MGATRALRGKTSRVPNAGARPVPPRADASGPEHWSVRVDRDSVARLDIPPHASRDRSFEIYCSLLVGHPGGGSASHALRVLVDGAHEWSRRVETDPGGRDTLDVRIRRVVPAGRALRLTAIAETDRAITLGLSITADED